MNNATDLQTIKTWIAQGNLEPASSALKAWVGQYPYDPEVRLHYALVLMQQNQLKAALTHLKLLSKDYSQVPAVAINRAEVLMRLNRADQAIEVLRVFVEARPQFVLARHRLARALNEAGHLRDAIEEYRLALAYDPGQGDTWFQLGCVLLDNGQADEAVDCLNQALERLPELCQPKVMQQLRRAWRMQGHLVREPAARWFTPASVNWPETQAQSFNLF